MDPKEFLGLSLQAENTEEAVTWALQSIAASLLRDAQEREPYTHPELGVA